jgi:hypothetical protein
MSVKSKIHFPTKLYQMIEAEDSDIIRWESGGNSFRIVDHHRFEQEVLPKHFRRECVVHSQVIVMITILQTPIWLQFKDS